MAYAYGGLWGIDDGSRAIQIVADDGDNIVDLVIPLLDCDDGTCVYDETKMYRTLAAGSEWRPYTHLMQPDIIEMNSLDPTDELSFEKWWAALRSKSNWRKVFEVT